MRHGRLASLLEESPRGEEDRVRWDFFDLANQLGEVLQNAEDALRLEQAVYGLDSLDDLRLHQLLVRGMSRWHTVQRDASIPTPAKRRNAKSPKAELVFTPLGKHLKMTEDWDLFSDTTGSDSVAPEAALWLSARTLRQFGNEPHSWTSETTKKFLAEPRIREAGLLAILFTESEEDLARELHTFESDLIAKTIPLSEARHVRSINITERLGHRLASIAMWRLKGE